MDFRINNQSFTYICSRLSYSFFPSWVNSTWYQTQDIFLPWNPIMLRLRQTEKNTTHFKWYWFMSVCMFTYYCFYWMLNWQHTRSSTPLGFYSPDIPNHIVSYNDNKALSLLFILKGKYPPFFSSGSWAGCDLTDMWPNCSLCLLCCT